MPFWEYPLNKERVPLSSVDPDDDDDDDDEGEDLPPYRDVPLAQSTDGNGGRRTNGRNGGKKTKKKSAHKAITIEEDSSFVNDDTTTNYGGNTITVTTATTSLKFYNDDDDEDDGGFGDGDYYSKKFGGSGAKRYNGLMTSSLRGSKKKKYRGLLIWAYIKHFLSCRWMCDFSGSSGGGCFSKMTRAMWLLFYLFLLAIIMTCAIAIGFIIAHEGNPFAEDEAIAAQKRAQGTANGGKTNSDASGGGGGNSLLPNLSKPPVLPPPPDNLYDLCDDWITKSGRDACSNACNVAECCTYPDGDRKNCRDGQEELCAKYRVACMAMELHMEEQAEEGSEFYEGANVDDNFDDDGSVNGDDDVVLEGTIALYKPPSYLEQICSSTSLQTPQGFDSCSKACKPSRCCNPEKYGCDVDDYLYCELYKKPCKVVEESWRGSGHAVASSSMRDDDDDDHGGNPFHSVGVGGKNDDDDDNDDDSDEDYDSAIANTVMSACNSANLNPPDKCIEACYPGACCYVTNTFPPIEIFFDKKYGAANNPIRHGATCVKNVGFCQQYGSCEHLNNLKDTSGWHSDDYTYELDVEGVCRAGYIAQFGALECSNICQPAHCCFSDEYACDEVQLGHLNCDDYAKCAVLYPNRKSTKELMQIAEHIDEICSEESVTTLSGRAECQEQCNGHLCCFDTGAYGCAGDPSQNCLAYAGCETLVITPRTSNDQSQSQSSNTINGVDGNTGPKDSDPDEFSLALQEACSEDSLKTLEGIQQCHNKCQTHLCCFTNESNLAGEDCSVATNEACDAYKPCQRLVSPGYAQSADKSSTLDMQYMKQSVQDKCSPPSNPYLIDEAWVAGCHAICADRFCCLVDERLDSSCVDSVGKAECSAYETCSILINDSGREITDINALQGSLAAVEEVCNSKVSSDSALHADCERKCDTRSCCFEPNPTYSCYHMEQDWCDEYKPCEYVGFHFFILSSEGGGENDSPAESPQQNIESSETAVTISPQNNEGGDYANVIGTDVASVCSRESLQTLYGIEQCYNKCQAHLCCFPTQNSISNQSCSDQYEQECGAYQQCEKLIYLDHNWNPPTIPYDLTNAVEKACTLPQDRIPVTPEWVANCHTVCASRLCCLADPSTQSSCVYTVGEMECNSYSTCKNLIGGDLRESDSIDDICNSRVSSDNNLHSACEDRCKLRSCCFEDAPFSCYHMEQQWCDDYVACEFIGLSFNTEMGSQNSEATSSQTSDSQTDSEGGTTGSLVDTQCASSLLDRNLDDCLTLCLPHECCFLAEDSCYFSNRDKCDKYATCRAVFEESKKRTGQVSEPVPTPPVPSSSSFSSATGYYSESYENKEGNTNSDFDSLCQPSNLGLNWNACRSHCEPYECCFSASDSCYDSQQAKCDEYNICKEFFVDTPGVKNDVAEPTQAEAKNAANSPEKDAGLISLMNEKCLPENLQQNWNACRSHCEPYECCFESLDSCYEARKDECHDYQICEEFFGNQLGVLDSTTVSNTDSSTNTHVQEVPAGNSAFLNMCSASHIGTNWSSCKTLCRPYECCFGLNGPCSTTTQASCDSYSLCQTFFDTINTGSSSVANSNTPNSQIQSSSGNYNSGSTSGSSNADTDSESQSSNGNDITGSVSAWATNSTPNQSDMEYICNLRLDDNLETCKNWCLAYECCFYISNSCYSYQSQKCDDHAICETVFEVLKQNPTVSQNIAPSEGVNGNAEQSVVKDDEIITKYEGLTESDLISLARACNDDQLQSDATQCKYLCDGSACCFNDSNQSNSCKDEATMRAYCEDHQICSGVFNKER